MLHVRQSAVASTNASFATITGDGVSGSRFWVYAGFRLFIGSSVYNGFWFRV